MLAIRLSCLAPALLVATVSGQAIDWTVGVENELPYDGALAFDVGRDRLVSFGGVRFDSGVPQFAEDATWEWSPSTGWVQRRPATMPTARIGHRAVYDAARREVVVFGGAGRSDGTVLRGDTWVWNGESWRRAATVGPAPRRHFGMAYDAARARVVVFGGEDATATRNDTWEWDGVTWTQRAPTRQPSPRTAAMAYDPTRGVTLLFGGSGNRDTWEWDGSNWTERVPTTGARPGPVDGPALAFDPTNGRIRMHGRFSGSAAFFEYAASLTSWGGGFFSGLPPADTFHDMVTDPVRDRLLLRSRDAFWSWDGTTWTELDLVAPRARNLGLFDAALAVDTFRGRVVRVGGNSGSTTVRGIDEWDGLAWHEVEPLLPGPGSYAAAYDAARLSTVVFSGADTYTWDGSALTRRNPTSSPRARFDHVMAYDASAQEVVLFGGAVTDPFGPPQALGDTWTWNGSDWSLAATSGPAARQGACIAYDPIRQRTVLFGGVRVGTVFGDTWEWDGTRWTLRQPATTSPPSRYEAAMAWHDAWQTVVLFGGRDGTTPSLRNDTWAWDGVDWQPVSTPTSPPPRASHAMVFDPRTQRLLVRGGIDTTQRPAPELTLWLGSTLPSTVVDFGAGCGSIAPTLRSPVPYLGNRGFAIEVHDAAPNTFGAVGIAATGGNQPLGSCTLYLQTPFVAVGAPVDGAGFARASLPLAALPSLLGIAFDVQAFAFDPAGAGFAGLAFTPGRSFAIGH